MTPTSATYSHSAFGRVVESAVPMRLLPDVGDSGVAQPPSARIIVDRSPIDPGGTQIGGDDGTTMTMYRQGEANLLALNTTGWVANMSEGNPVVTLRPDARRLDDGRWEESLNTRILGDRLVTAVVPYLPSVCGELAIHGSLLTRGDVTILLLGESGFGKSTISQYLRMDHGWDVLDDDTSLFSMEGDVRLVPMGAQSRLRSDASKYLGLPVVDLPGYGGHKSAVTITREGSSDSHSCELSAIVQLGPAGSKHGGEPGHLGLEPRTPDKAVGGIFESLFSLSPDRQPAVQRQFQAAARGASIPHYVLNYDKAQHDAQLTASLLADELASSLSS